MCFQGTILNLKRDATVRDAAQELLLRSGYSPWMLRDDSNLKDPEDTFNRWQDAPEGTGYECPRDPRYPTSKRTSPEPPEKAWPRKHLLGQKEKAALKGETQDLLGEIQIVATKVGPELNFV